MQHIWNLLRTFPLTDCSGRIGNARPKIARGVGAHALTIRYSPFAICHSRFAILLMLLIPVLLLASPGCRKQDPGFEIVTLEGKIEQIERITDETGEITLLYYSEKHKQEMTGMGLVTRETEIMINGAIGKLQDLREGDRVRGEVRIEKTGKEKRQIALKIYVDRPTSVGDEGE